MKNDATSEVTPTTDRLDDALALVEWLKAARGGWFAPVLINDIRTTLAWLIAECEMLRDDGTVWADMNAAVADEHERAEAALKEVAELHTTLLDVRRCHGAQGGTTPPLQTWRYCAAAEAECERLRAALRATAAMGSSFFWSTRLQKQVVDALGESIKFGARAVVVPTQSEKQ